MPEIAIKQTLNDASLKKGLAESATSIRGWGREAEKIFQATQSAADKYSAELERLNKLHRDGYLAADSYNKKLAELQTAKNPIGPAQSIGGSVDNRSSEAYSVWESTRTSAEKYSAVLERLQSLHKSGYITADTYTRAIAKAGDDYQIFGAQASEAEKKVSPLHRVMNAIAGQAIGKGPVGTFMRFGGAVSDLSAITAGLGIATGGFIALTMAAARFGDEIKNAKRHAVELGMSYDEYARKNNVKRYSERAEAGLEFASEVKNRAFGEQLGWAMSWFDPMPMQTRKFIEEQELAQVKMEASVKRSADAWAEMNGLVETFGERIGAIDKDNSLQGIVDKIEQMRGTLGDAATNDLIEKAVNYNADAEQKKNDDKFNKMLKDADDAEKKAMNALNAIGRPEPTQEQQILDELKQSQAGPEAIAAAEKAAAAAEKRRDAIKEAAEAEERATRAAQMAASFEANMRDEFKAREGETSREAQLRHMAEQGVGMDKLSGFARQVAQLDAEDQIAKRTERPTLAPGAIYGSREDARMRAEAINAMGRPDAEKQRQDRIEQQAEQRFQRLIEVLTVISNQQAEIAPEPA